MWAGGKTRLLKKYSDHLPESFDHYIEPFLGGGAMFIWAHKKNPDAKFVLNDMNDSIMMIYSLVKNNCAAFMEHVDHLSSQYLPLSRPDRKKFYYDLRHKHAYDHKAMSRTEEAATLYFLMKTCFNGIWQINKNTNGRFGTPAGLLNQKNEVYDRENLLLWNEALQNCVLIASDFKKTMSYIRRDCFIFLDPPYRCSFTQYGVDFDDLLQAEVVAYLKYAKSKGAYCLMSNRDSNSGFFEDLLGDNEMVYFDVKYTAGRRKKNKDGTFSAKKAREILMIGDGRKKEDGN